MRTPARRTLLLALLLVASGFLAVKASESLVRYGTLRQELASIHGQMDAARDGNARLARQLERMQEPTWLALLARQRLNYAMPGETVVFVYKSADSAIISQPQQAPAPPYWRQWLDWLLDPRRD